MLAGILAVVVAFIQLLVRSIPTHTTDFMASWSLAKVSNPLSHLSHMLILLSSTTPDSPCVMLHHLDEAQEQWRVHSFRRCPLML